MSVSCGDIFSAAVRYAAASEEVEWRNATSRAYYAAYHLVKARCASSAHHAHYQTAGYGQDALIQALITSPSNASGSLLARQLGYVLTDMKKKRVWADYFLDEDLERKDAELQIATYRKFESRATDLP